MALSQQIVEALQAVGADIKALLTGKQDVLISGQNIKTINGQSLLGAGNVSISAAIFKAVVSVVPAKIGQAERVVTDANVSANSKIMCQLEPNTDFDVDELAEFILSAQAGNGQIIFTIVSDGAIVGDFNILYTIG